MYIAGRFVPRRVLVLAAVAAIALPIIGGVIVLLIGYIWEYYHPR